MLRPTPTAPVPLPRRRALALVAAACWAGGRSASAQPVAPENRLKAAMLAKFAQYLEWPAAAFATPTSPIVIGVLGEDLFGPEFEASLKTFKIGARTVTARRCASGEDCAGCHLLYLNLPEATELQSQLTGLRQRPVFTASDHPDFLKFGGILRFWRNGDQLAFEINAEALRTAGLTAHPRMLQLSRSPAPRQP